MGWEETSTTNAYRVIFPDLTLRISRDFTVYDQVVGGQPVYQLELESDRGRIIESLTPTHGDVMYQVLSEIFDLAKDYIHDTGINKALDYLRRA